MEINENSTVETVEAEGTPAVDTPKTYTQEEFQSELDRRVTAALKTQQKKFDKQLSLSKLDESERAKAEKDDRIAELEEQLAQFQIERNRSELKSVLASRGLSVEFADIIKISDDIEASQAIIDKLYKLYKADVKAAVEERLAGTAPKGNGKNTVAAVTRESLLKMNVSELQAFKAKQPELYKSLINS